MIDPNTPFLRPLLVRLILVAIPLAACVYAMGHGALGWAIVAGAVGGWLFWALFLQAD